MKKHGPFVILALIVLASSVALDEFARERIALTIHPSAQRAYQDGEYHFNSLDAEHYDINEAEQFFDIAVDLDPKYPYVHHQLARIAFIEGNYQKALSEVNKEIANDPGKTEPSPYYLRGIVEGYLGEYDAAARDYKQYVELSPAGWEGRTDYAWTLIKTGDLKTALEDIKQGLADHPGNPWLLSVQATVLYEQGNYAAALPVAQQAKAAIDGITPAMWLKAYPGNDPSVAAAGIATLRAAAQKNLEKIQEAISGKKTDTKHL